MAKLGSLVSLLLFFPILLWLIILKLTFGRRYDFIVYLCALLVKVERKISISYRWLIRFPSCPILLYTFILVCTQVNKIMIICFRPFFSGLKLTLGQVIVCFIIYLCISFFNVRRLKSDAARNQRRWKKWHLKIAKFCKCCN